MTQTEPPAFNPITSAWNTVASFTSYEEAQAAIDKLSDLQFPVENLDIIGSDLRTVEHITGRLTRGRATTAGAATGAWFGLFFGLLVGLFSTGPTWVGLILGGVSCLVASAGGWYALRRAAARSDRDARDEPSAPEQAQVAA